MARRKSENSLNYTRVNLTIENNTLQRIDKFAFENGITRSGAICIMCNDYIRQMESENTLKGLLPFLKSSDGNSDVQKMIDMLQSGDFPAGSAEVDSSGEPLAAGNFR